MIASMSDGSLGDVQPRISPGDKGFDWGIVMIKSFKSATDDWKQKSFIRPSKGTLKYGHTTHVVA
jgi:hypothetical protein